MGKMNFNINRNKKLVTVLILASMVIVPLFVMIPSVHSDPLDDSFLYNELLPADKNVIGEGKSTFTISSSITAGANYLIHAQADVTNDNAGNGADPGDTDPDDGGWDWVLTAPTFIHSVAASPTNIYGATALGLYYAYRAAQLNSLTPDPKYMIAMKDAADKMVANANIRSAADLIFLMLYDDLPSVCGTTYQAAAKTKYDARITAYGSATLLAQAIRDVRGVTQGYPNGIIAWDIGAWVRVAAMLDARYGGTYGADADAMAEVIYQDSYMNNPGYFDIDVDNGWDPTYTNVNYWWYTLGVTGLIDAFDAAQVHTTEIPGLLTILFACQYPSGAFSYCYGANTNDEDWQSTAYAVMTLGNLNAYTYRTQIQAACAWIASTQDPSGGYVYSSGNHYPEVGGENTAALYFAGTVFNLNTGEVFWSIQAAIDDLDTINGNTIEVLPGTYKGLIIVYKEVTIHSSGGYITTTVDASQIDVCNYKNQWCKGISYAWAQANDPGLLKNGFLVFVDNVVIDGFKIINAYFPSNYNRGIGVIIGTISTTYVSWCPWNVDQWGGTVPNPIIPHPTGVTIRNNYIVNPTDGIYNWASNGNTIEYNTVINSAMLGGTGIICYEGGTNNIIRGNTIDNAADAAICVAGAWPNILLDVSNTQVYDNTVTNSNIGIKFYNIAGSGVAAYHNNIYDNNIGISVEGAGGALVGTAYENNIVDNTMGVQNTAPDGIFVATCNWWGDASGPGPIATGSGDPVSTNVEYCPWLDAAYPDGSCNGGGYIMCNINGPYYTGPSDNYFVQLCGKCEFINICGDIIEATSYFWDFGDGQTSTEQCPGHTYDPDCPDEAGFITYFVTYTVTYDDGTIFLTCSDMAVVTVYCDDNDPPITQLIYPTGGETLSGTETVSWFALDEQLLIDLPIRLYYSPAGMNNWMQIGGVLYNNIDETHGSYNWNTNTLSDGSYKLKVVAQDNFYNIAESESKAFTINNGYAGARVSSIQIMDTSINSDSWVKDGDTIEITAGITGGSSLTREGITADLSGFGKASSVAADNYDGYFATWVVTDVTCTPSDGQIQVTVTTDGDTNTGVITADNTIPEINLVKPKTGLYLFNTRVFPMSRTVVIGEITIVVDAVDISMAEFYVDVLDGHPEGFVIQAPFSWTLNYKLKGLHTVKIRLTDFAGNMNEQSLDLFIHNPRGKPLN